MTRYVVVYGLLEVMISELILIWVILNLRLYHSVSPTLQSQKCECPLFFGVKVICQ